MLKSHYYFLFNEDQKTNLKFIYFTGKLLTFPKTVENSTK